MSRNSDLYTGDFYTWTQTTAALIRAGKWLDIDPESLAEEVESLGKSQQRELASRLDVLLMHLLKWRYQPERRQTGQSWRSTIRTQRRELRRLLMHSPGLASLVEPTITDSYAEACLDAADETGLPLRTFPPACPWTPTQILHADFFPEAH
jgi:hypothetical protein